MPAQPLRADSCSFLDEANHLSSAMSALSTSDKPKTTAGPAMSPVRKGLHVPIVSPSAASSASDDSYEGSVDEESSPARRSADPNDADVYDSATKDAVNSIVITEHKRAELEGRHAEEPLLKENPNRFVLFPIQDAEVSIAIVASYLLCLFVTGGGAACIHIHLGKGPNWRFEFRFRQ